MRRRAKFRKVTNNIDESIEKTDKAPFVMGDAVSWANLFLSAFLMYHKDILGEVEVAS